MVSGRAFTKLRFVEELDDWSLTCMITDIVTSLEPSALSFELACVFDANAPPQPSAAPPVGEPRLAAPSGVARELDSQGAAGD